MEHFTSTSGSGSGNTISTGQASTQPGGRAATVSPEAGTRYRKKKQPQARQLLSCSKCRERKVRCDRTKPCSACCARGHPKECVFTLGEGTAFGPIQQSLELRKLRAENQRLKERLLKARLPVGGDSDEDAGLATPSQPFKAAQRRFGTDDPVESLYFGSPGMLSVISDFAETQMDSKSLSHTVPRAISFYRSEGVTMYPFPTIWTSGTWVHGLYSCLQPWEEVVSYLDAYTARAETFVWPHLAQEVNKKEVERFMADFAQNAETYPDMLALIFAALATGVQRGVFERSGSQWIAGAVERERLKGDLFVSACMQALRHSSYLSQPTLLSLQALIMLGPYLTNSGRFADAWTLFGTTIRAAQSLGLHRNPKFCNPIPSLRESALRKKLWWWMLHMDQHYSMTLGRPLGISAIGDCPFVEPLTTEPAILRTGECFNHLTVLGRQILSSAQLTSTRIYQLSDKLLGVLDMLPDEMQFNDHWLADASKIPESPLDEHAAVLYGMVHNYLILLNRQCIDNAMAESSEQSPKAIGSGQHSLYGGHGQYSLQSSSEVDLSRGRPQVLLSSTVILSCFEFYHVRLPGSLIDWTVGQQAFNAAMILLLDMQEQKNQVHLVKVDSALRIFQELCEKGIHKLSKMAVEHITLERTRLLSILREAWESHSHMNQSVANPYSRRDSQMSISTTPQMPQGPFASPVVVRRFEPVDTVMGSTGMFLVDDQRSQRAGPSFNQERRPSAQYATPGIAQQQTTTGYMALPMAQHHLPNQQSQYQQYPLQYQTHAHAQDPNLYMTGMHHPTSHQYVYPSEPSSTHTSPTTLRQGESSANHSRRSSHQSQAYRPNPPPGWGGSQ